MNKKQAEITEEWIGYSHKCLNEAIRTMAGARRLKWMKDGPWELATRNIEDKLWEAEEEMNAVLVQLYDLADL